MSLGARATRGGGGAKTATKDSKHNHQEAKGKGAEKQPAKDKVKPQATTEQLRMASMIDRKNEDTLDVRRMVLELMEMTCRTEEEVCSALHDSDNDITLACELLLEESQRIQGEWQTSEKKKKKSSSAAGNGDAGPPGSLDPRSRSAPRQRRDGGGGEGGPRGRGSGRGRGAPRGGRAGGRGLGRPRPGGPRGRAHDDDNTNHYGSSGGAFPATEDWDTDDKYVSNTASFPAAEDWDNEEWSGSLADTKVFTPSAGAAPPAEPEPQQAQLNSSLTENWDLDEGPGNNGPTAEATHLNYTYHNSTHQLNKSSESAAGRKPLESVSSPVSSTDLAHSMNQPQQPIGLSGSLSAAQSQYLSQLTQQSQQHENSVYTTNYGVYGSADLSSQRKPQRARVPPPSKIPSSAVEMPGEPGQISFIDVQFGALEPETLAETQPTLHQPAPKPQVTSQAEPAPVAHPAHDAIPETNSYSSAASMLSESLSVVDTTPNSQPVTVDASAASSLESRLSASMKQLSTSEAGAGGADAAAPATQPYAAAAYHQQQYVAPHRTTKHQTVGQQSVYATHHAVSHHPVYGASVYAQQVSGGGAASLAAASLSSPYPPSVTLPQYHTQPLNSYQQTSSTASVYGGSALYTAAPYTAYQPAAPKLSSGGKEPAQYDAAAAQRPLAAAATQAPPAKVTSAAVKVTSGSNASAAAYAVQAQPQPQAFYTQQQGQVGAAAYAAYAEEAQMMRGTLPHHLVNNGGYYEVNYGGVTGAREPAAGFGLGGGERFGRAEASSPQQVTAALPPGYAYFFQPPPPTYQYGVYPYGGGGSSVGSVTGVGGVSAAAGGKVGYSQQQQPQYDAQPQQDTYKQGAYSAAGKSGGSAQAGADLTSAMYAKAHASLNKVNSYEKAAFHSGTPPPFGGGSAAPHHLYIPAAPQPQPHHNAHHHHQPPQHQMDVRVVSNHRRESSGGAARGAGAGAGKPAGSKPYSQSYWAPN